MPIITKCQVCGKEIKSSPSRIKKTCSKKCAGILLSRTKSQGAKSICQQCGKEFPHKPSKSPKFCSIKCKALSQKGKGEYKIELDMDEIKRLYLEEKLSTIEIAEKMGSYKKMIRQRLLDMNVKMRTSGESKSLFLLKHPEQNPNNLPGVKEKQIQAQKNFNKNNPEIIKERNKSIKEGWNNHSEENKNKHSKNLKDIKLSRTPKQVKDQMIKQFNTKRKNGTFNCTGIENKYAAILDAQGVEYIREYIIPEGVKRYRYDFYIPSENMLVEINGTGTHADPKKYEKDDVLKLGIPGWTVCTAEELWHKDEVKKVYAVRKGYNTKTIWERDL